MLNHHFWYRGYASSRQWFLRQSKDPFVKAAQDANFRSRAAFKLAQLHQKYRILQKSFLVIDIGAAPGGWSQYCSQVGVAKTIAIDLLPIDPIDRVEFLQGDFTEAALQEKILALTNDRKVDVVLSDMAPPISGIRDQDHIHSLQLVKAALKFAIHTLKPKGHFIAKVFQGRYDQDLKEAASQHFARVLWAKPDASRKESSEVYLVCLEKESECIE